REDACPVRPPAVAPRISGGSLASPHRRGTIGGGLVSTPPARCPMSRQLICPQGHQLEIDTTAEADRSGAPAVCPVRPAPAVAQNPRTETFVRGARSRPEPLVQQVRSIVV